MIIVEWAGAPGTCVLVLAGISGSASSCTPGTCVLVLAGESQDLRAAVGVAFSMAGSQDLQ